VLVDTNGKVKLADFGYQMFVQILLSKIAADSSYHMKDFWIAPENLIGLGSLEYLSDIWSIGCLAYELCTGSPPFVDQIGWDHNKLRELHLNKGTLLSTRAAEVSSWYIFRVLGLHEDLSGL
jgi:serine/threonine protein kinase